MNEIPNVSLELAKIPKPSADWGKIGAFALTFNGFEHWTSFKACSEVAERWLKNYEADGSLPQTLTELRTCLFFEQRRWRHYGYIPTETAMRYIRDLVVGIRSKVHHSELE